MRFRPRRPQRTRARMRRGSAALVSAALPRNRNLLPTRPTIHTRMSDSSYRVQSGATRPSVNRTACAVVAGLFIAGCVYLTLTVSGRQAALFGVGVLIGVSLYHGQFSFTSAWRQFIVERRGGGIRSHGVL